MKKSKNIREVEKSLKQYNYCLDLIYSRKLPRLDNEEDFMVLKSFWQLDNKREFLNNLKIQLKVLEETKKMLIQEEKEMEREKALGISRRNPVTEKKSFSAQIIPFPLSNRAKTGT